MDHMTALARCLSERFGCEAKVTEGYLALLCLAGSQHNLGDVCRLIRELSVKAACVTLTLQLGHIRRTHPSLKRKQVETEQRCEGETC